MLDSQQLARRKSFASTLTGPPVVIPVFKNLLSAAIRFGGDIGAGAVGFGVHFFVSSHRGVQRVFNRRPRTGIELPRVEALNSRTQTKRTMRSQIILWLVSAVSTSGFGARRVTIHESTQTLLRLHDADEEDEEVASRIRLNRKCPNHGRRECAWAVATTTHHMGIRMRRLWNLGRA